MSQSRAETLPYRPCVGLMLLNANKHVFVARRIDQEIESWQMPQGGIDDGEKPIDAAFREMEEEIGTKQADIIAEASEWLTYDLPPDLVGKALKGKFRGQKQRWFLLRYTGTDEDINLDTEHPEFDAWRWVQPSETIDLIVDFKRPLYRGVINAFRDYL